jgi:hypothetical protein
MAIDRKEMNSKLDDAERRDDATNTAQDTALDRIKDRIEHANQSIEAGNSILGKLSEALRLNWLRQLGSELKTLMHGAIAVNFATYRAVIRLQISLPSRLERGLIEAPVFFGRFPRPHSTGTLAVCHIMGRIQLRTGGTTREHPRT